MKRIVWTFGLISGAILSATMMISISLQKSIGEHSLIIGYTTMVLSFLLIFFGVRSYRDNVGHGMVSFGRAFAVGGLIMVIASLCYVATWEVVYFKFMPDFADKYATYAIDKARRSGASEAEIQQKQAEMQVFAERYKNPLYNSAMTFVEPLPVGLLMTLIAAGVLRRKRKEESRGTLASSAVV
jgi:hypothetical protein